MPFRSKAQAAFLKTHNPAVYKKFAAATPKGTRLPAELPAKPKHKAKRRAVR